MAWLAPLSWWAAPRQREARLEDAGRFAEIHAEGFHMGWDRHEMETLLVGGCIADTLLSRGFFGEVVTGFALSRVVMEEAELLSIALDREVRGKGHAAPLLAAHAARLRRAGAESLFLEVAADNAPALALYRGFGFEEIGRRKGYYPAVEGAQSARRDAITMRRDLSALDPTPRYG